MLLFFKKPIRSGVHLNKTVVYATWVLIMYFIFMLINGGGGNVAFLLEYFYKRKKLK